MVTPMYVTASQTDSRHSRWQRNMYSCLSQCSAAPSCPDLIQKAVKPLSFRRMLSSLVNDSCEGSARIETGAHCFAALLVLYPGRLRPVIQPGGMISMWAVCEVQYLTASLSMR